MEIYRRNGTLQGRYNPAWKPKVSWRCLTGEAQTALVLLRLSRLTGRPEYAECAKALLVGVAALQDIHSPHPETRGIPGSHPLWGGYGPFNYLNWAAKFFMDGLLFELHSIDVQEQPMRLPMEASA
jgi:hypothetical protein